MERCNAKMHKIVNKNRYTRALLLGVAAIGGIEVAVGAKAIAVIDILRRRWPPMASNVIEGQLPSQQPFYHTRRALLSRVLYLCLKTLTNSLAGGL